jgi:hypothetical protein
MKWEIFKSLTPFERRKLRKSKSHGELRVDRILSNYGKSLPQSDFEKYPEVQQCCLAFIRYLENDISEADKDKAIAAIMFFAKIYPDTFFGYINDDKQFVLGLIPILGFISLRPKTYNDHLDDILSEDDLHNLTQDEVVSMACDRGMKGCNSALLRQRVKNWDKE